MPTTIFNWLTATSRPRRPAGAISVIYIGHTTEALPTATPPNQRKNNSAYQFQATAQPAAETKKRTASTARTGRRPHRSAGRPASKEPTIVPISALDTVKPRKKLLSWKTFCKDSVVPEITAVSKPNKNEPKAATTALSNKVPPRVRTGSSAERAAGETFG